MQILTSLCQTILSVWQFPALAILSMSFITFCLYGIDKWKARRGSWRISEKALLLTTFCFGGIGAFLGMRIFHHKTKHWYFQVFVPIFLILQIATILTVVVLGNYINLLS